MAFSCLIFDCDGVLIESVPVKTRAFARVAEPFGAEAVDRLVMYHTMHGGISRYTKFEWLYREVLGREITPEELEELGRRYADIAFDELCRCAVVPGAVDVLTRWRGRVPMYVCSGAPHEELLVVLERHGLHQYFTGIFGSPPAKTALLRDIILRAGVDPATAVMVGDSGTDLHAAEAVGTLFYGRGEELKGGNFPWGEDLTGLNSWLESL